MPATAQDVAHIRAAYEDFNARYEQLADPELMRAYEGLEGYKRWYAENYATYDDVRLDVESVAPVGDHVVALARVSGRPKGEETRLAA